MDDLPEDILATIASLTDSNLLKNTSTKLRKVIGSVTYKRLKLKALEDYTNTFITEKYFWRKRPLLSGPSDIELVEAILKESFERGSTEEILFLCSICDKKERTQLLQLSIKPIAYHRMYGLIKRIVCGPPLVIDGLYSNMETINEIYDVQVSSSNDIVQMFLKREMKRQGSLKQFADCLRLFVETSAEHRIPSKTIRDRAHLFHHFTEHVPGLIITKQLARQLCRYSIEGYNNNRQFEIIENRLASLTDNNNMLVDKRGVYIRSIKDCGIDAFIEIVEKSNTTTVSEMFNMLCKEGSTKISVEIFKANNNTSHSSIKRFLSLVNEQQNKEEIIRAIKGRTIAEDCMYRVVEFGKDFPYIKCVLDSIVVPSNVHRYKQ